MLPVAVWSHQEASSRVPPYLCPEGGRGKAGGAAGGGTQGGQSALFLGLVHIKHRAHLKFRLRYSLANEKNTASAQCPQELSKTGKNSQMSLLNSLTKSGSFLSVSEVIC